MKVEILREFREADATDLGELMCELKPDFAGEIDAKMLREIIASPHHAIFAARDHSRIVGVAILSEILDLADGRIAYLSCFATSAHIRSRGVGSAIWDAMLDWCAAREIKLMEFTSNKTRAAAHNFYLKKGCQIYDTTVFKLLLT